MAKGDYISFKLDGYRTGMENDPQFEAVSFRFGVPEESKGDIKATNKFRGVKITEYAKLYDVKPLGAVPTGGKKVDNAYIATLWGAADSTRVKGGKHFGKSDEDMIPLILKIYRTKYPTHEVNEDTFLAVRDKKASAEDLLNQI